MTSDASTPGALPTGLFVGQWLPYSETFVYDQLRFQQRLRARVCARAHHADGARFPYPELTVLSPLQALRYWAHGRAPRFVRALSGVRLLHAHFGTNGVRALPVAAQLDCPLIVSFHGHDVGGLFPGNRHSLRYANYQRLAPRLFERAALLLCASSELASLLTQRFGAPEHKVVVHRLGVDLSRFTPVQRPERPPVVLMVGRLVPKKGMALGVRAFARALRRHPEARLHIVGDGPLRRPLQRLVHELGVTHAVRMDGPLPVDLVLGAMADADVLMTPSLEGKDADRESGVLVLKEAAATAMATLGTRHGGIPEIIDDGQTGCLVPPGQVAPLADALDALLGSGPLRTRLGAQARAKMEREYDAVRLNAAYESLALSVL